MREREEIEKELATIIEKYRKMVEKYRKTLSTKDEEETLRLEEEVWTGLVKLLAEYLLDLRECFKGISDALRAIALEKVVRK